MAAMTDLATPLAATTAGYAQIQINRGAGGKNLQFVTIFEKWMTGEPGKKGFNLRAVGESAASAGAADTAALANLNVQRDKRYGKGPLQNAGALPANAGFQHTPDIS
jgi:hypothetical protein